MPIRPKHTPSKDRPVAQRQFTDREGFIAAFQKALAESRTVEPHVLVYYGVGGIGKSSLRRELGKLVAEQDRVVSAVLDFETPSYRDMETALFALRKSLLSSFKVHFPTFDIAYAVYWQKSRPQTPMTEDNLSLMQDSMVLSDLLAAGGVVPIIGVLPRLPYLFARGRKVVQDWWVRRGSTELKELPTLEPQVIAERLPGFWAADLKDHMERTGQRVVLFLDTYEALTGGERSEARLRQRDEWVRETVAHVPEVLWVVCGREKLRWEEVDADWQSCLDQHLMGGLSDSDAQRFLQSCGIESAAVREAVVKGSEGVPYYLDIAVDSWLEISERKRREPEPQDFAHTPLEVFDRFLRHLTQPEIETLKVLSVPRFWDCELFERLVTRFQTGFPLTAFQDLCRFSFISESAAVDSYTMHQLMRQSLQEHASPELVGRAHRFLFEFYDGQLKDIDVRGITDRQKVALAEAFHHGRAVLGAHELFEWYAARADVFDEAGQWRFVMPNYEELVRVLEGDLGPEHPDVAAALNNIGKALAHQKKSGPAAEYFKRSLAIWLRAYGEEHPKVAHAYSNLGVTHCERGEYPVALGYYEKSLAIRERVLGPEHPDVGVSLNNIGDAYRRMGEYAKARPYIEKGLAVFQKVYGEEHPNTATARFNLGTVLYVCGDYPAALEQLGRSLEIGLKIFGPNHPSVADTYCTIGVVHWAMGDLDSAREDYLKSLAIGLEVFGEDHPNVAGTYHNLGILGREQRDFPRALEYLERALAIFGRVFGAAHPHIAESHLDLAETLHQMERHADAVREIREAADMYAKFGLWKKTAELLDTLATWHESAENPKEAEAVRAEARKVRADHSEQ